MGRPSGLFFRGSMRLTSVLGPVFGLAIALLGACEPGSAGDGTQPAPDTDLPQPGAGETGATGATRPEVPRSEVDEPDGPPAPSYTARPEDLFEPEQPLDDPSGRALDSFYAALAELDDGGPRMVRVTHIGDSSIGLDGLTKTLRSRMQERFGDGGPGFLLMGRYSPNYRPASVAYASYGWRECYIAYGCKGDGHYGLGGVTFDAKHGSKTIIKTPAPDPNEYVAGTRFSHVELWLAARPRGGKPIGVHGKADKVDDAARKAANTLAQRLERHFGKSEKHKHEPRPDKVM